MNDALQKGVERANQWLLDNNLPTFTNDFERLYDDEENHEFRHIKEDFYISQVWNECGDNNCFKGWIIELADENGDMHMVVEETNFETALVAFRLYQLRQSWLNDLQPEDFS